MQEYIIDVTIDGKEEQLKTYSESELEALDSMIGFSCVEGITLITRTEDKETWEFNNEDLPKLRELRSFIDNEKLIIEELRSRKTWN